MTKHYFYFQTSSPSPMNAVAASFSEEEVHQQSASGSRHSPVRKTFEKHARRGRES